MLPTILRSAWSMRQPPPGMDDYASANDTPIAEGGRRISQGQDIDSDALPLVSIVTVTFNAAKTLPSTLKSIRDQTYRNVEHIVVDGGSNDATLELLRAAGDSIGYWRSSPDRGIYDAMNRGISLARGRFIGVLNADDWYEPDQIENAVRVLQVTDAPFVHGNIVMHGWQGQDVELHGDPQYQLSVQRTMPMVLHVTILARRQLFERHGLFRTSFKIAADYDWLVRLAHAGEIGTHSPSIRAHMRAGGISTTRQRLAILEAGVIAKGHGRSWARVLAHNAVWLTWPNGAPPRVQRWISRSASLARRIRRPEPAAALPEPKPLPPDGPAPAPSQPTPPPFDPKLIEGFLSARQMGGGISDEGLGWLATLGIERPSFRTHSRHCAAEQAVMALKGSGWREADSSDAAGVTLIDLRDLQPADADLKRGSDYLLVMHDVNQRVMAGDSRTFGCMTVLGTRTER